MALPPSLASAASPDLAAPAAIRHETDVRQAGGWACLPTQQCKQLPQPSTSATASTTQHWQQPLPATLHASHKAQHTPLPLSDTRSPAVRCRQLQAPPPAYHRHPGPALPPPQQHRCGTATAAGHQRQLHTAQQSYTTWGCSTADRSTTPPLQQQHQPARRSPPLHAPALSATSPTAPHSAPLSASSHQRRLTPRRSAPAPSSPCSSP
jgi:hypothetical protein